MSKFKAVAQRVLDDFWENVDREADAENDPSIIEAALTAAWNEAVEAAAKRSYFPDPATGVAGAIRRLAIDAEEGG